MTAPNLEHRVAAIFRNLSYQHHLFCHRVRSVIRGRIVERLRPAFPRYIFLRMMTDDMWFSVLEIASVSRFVCGYSGDPIIVPQMVVDELVTRQMDGALPNPIASRFKFGDKVRIVGEQNCVFGNLGIYQYPVVPGRAFVLLPWFNDAWSRTEVDERDIEPFEPLRVDRPARKDRGRHRRGGRRAGRHTANLFAAACHA